jgi:hypothetical protein
MAVYWIATFPEWLESGSCDPVRSSKVFRPAPTLGPIHGGRFGKNFGIKSYFRLFLRKISCSVFLRSIIPKITLISNFVRPGGSSY